MDLDLHIRRNPAAVALAVQQPAFAADFARMFEDFLSPDPAAAGAGGAAVDQRADADVLFLLWSEDDSFWPASGNHGDCVIGALGFEQAMLDLRGELTPEG